MSKEVLFILIMTALTALFAAVITYSEIKKRKKRRNIYYRRSEKKVAVTIYEWLVRFPLTKNYIYKLNLRYRMISPCDENEAALRTIGVAILSWVICGTASVVMILINPIFINALIAIEIVCIVNSEIVSRMVEYYELQLLHEIMEFVSEVKHNYFVMQRVDDAVYRSLDGLPKGIKPHALLIYDILLSAEKEEDERKYYSKFPNKYLREFLNLAINVMENGDQIVDGNLLFAKNLENLNREIEMEIDKKERLKNEFTGLILVSILPLFFIEYIKQMALMLAEEMESFYYGRNGMICDIGIMILFGFIYIILRKNAEYKPYRKKDYRWIHRLERVKLIKIALDNYESKNAGKMKQLKIKLRNNGERIKPRTYLLRSLSFGTLAFIISFLIVSYSHVLNKKELLHNVTNVENLTTAARENQYQTMEEIILEKTNEYITPNQILPKNENLINILTKDGRIKNTVVIESMTDEIIRRVTKYQTEYLKYYEVLLCILVGIGAYFLPDFMLWYNRTVAVREIEDEVNQFNGLIYMLMHIDSMTSKKILTEMESFSVIFKQSLRECLNDFSAGDIEALEELKHKEREYRSFVRIVDNLIRCDDMPIREAFDEVNVDRENLFSKRKRENEVSIKKRATKGFILAVIPIVTLFAYLIIPVFISKYGEIESLLQEFKSI